MAFKASVICDSININTKDRLTTFLVTYPLIVHAEHLRHRMMSFSVSSSRAIPTKKIIEQVESDPYIPFHWGAQEPGMQANTEVSEDQKMLAKEEYMFSLNSALNTAKNMANIGLHKQVVNRILSPYMWVTVLVSATTYSNFFKLRCHEAAEPNIRKIAEMMRELYIMSEPKILLEGDWHLPFVQDSEKEIYNITTLKRISTARCARTSYLNHDGTFELEKDIKLHKKLADSGHYSPMEHIATPGRGLANFRGWIQYRSEFPRENGI